MNDLPPRRAMTQLERETLSTPEEISRAQESASVSARTRFEEPSPEYIARLKAADGVQGRFDVVLRDPAIRNDKELTQELIAFLVGEVVKLERKLAEIQTEYDDIRAFAIRDFGVWRHGQSYERNSLVTWRDVDCKE